MFYRIIYFWTICIVAFSAQASNRLNNTAYPLHTILLSSDSYQSKLSRITQVLKDVNPNKEKIGDPLIIIALTPAKRISSPELNANADIINKLLMHGTNVNDENKDGDTALIKCMHNLSKENIQNMKILIKHHANVNHSNRNGNHALIELLRHNSSVDNNDANTINAMHILLKNHISLDKQDKNGNTALHLAIENGQYDIAKLLVQYGASYTINNNNGIAPETIPSFKSSVLNMQYKEASMCINELESADKNKNSEIKNILMPFKCAIKHELETYNRLKAFKSELKSIREDVYNDWVSFMVFKRGTHDKAFENDILHLPALIIEEIFKYTCPTLPSKKAFWKSKKRVNQELLNSKELTNNNEFRSKKLKYNHE